MKRLIEWLFGFETASIINEIYDEVRDAVSRWDGFADEAGVSRKLRQGLRIMAK